MLRNIFVLLQYQIGAAAFLMSLLAVFPAPTNFLWVVSIGVTEWGHVLAFLAVIPLFYHPWENWHRRLVTLLSVTAVVLSLSPLVRAKWVASDLPDQIRQAWGAENFLHAGRSTPLDFSDVILGLDQPDEPYLTLTYSAVDSEQLTLDYYESSGKNKSSPCVVAIHGGAWNKGHSQELRPLSSYLARHGYAVASVNYRLAPKWKFPAQIEDLHAALRFLKTNCSPLKLDTTRFVLLGRSAGGQLTLLAAYTFHDPGIRGVISFYAPADMVYAGSKPGNPRLLDSRKVLADYLGDTYEKNPTIYKSASPLEYVDSMSPPTLMIHGIRDEMVAYEHSRRLNQKLNDLQVPHLLVTLPWMTHAGDFNFSGPSGQISTYAVERFLEKVTK